MSLLSARRHSGRAQSGIRASSVIKSASGRPRTRSGGAARRACVRRLRAVPPRALRPSFRRARAGSTPRASRATRRYRRRPSSQRPSLVLAGVPARERRRRASRERENFLLASDRVVRPRVVLFAATMATARRDTLLELQARAQKKWADEKTFEVSAPKDGASARRRPSPVVVVVVVVVVRRIALAIDDRSIDEVPSDRAASPLRALSLSPSPPLTHPRAARTFRADRTRRL